MSVGEMNMRVRRASTPGANTQILFNNNGVDGANVNLTYNYNTSYLSLGGTATISGGGSQPLQLATNSAGPWGLSLYRTDLAQQSRVFNFGGNDWSFEHSPKVPGLIFTGGTGAVINSSPHTYGSIAVSGTSTGYAGIQFVSSGGVQGRTLMVGAAISGMFDSNASAWDWQFSAGALVIGTVPASAVTAGSFAAGSFVVSATMSAATFNATSDRKKKKKITKIKDHKEILKGLNGVRFEWKEDSVKSAGLIAQDVEKVLPEAVSTTDAGTKTLNYNAIIGVLVEAVKELQIEVARLKAK